MDGTEMGGVFDVDAATIPLRMRCIDACCWLISWIRRASRYGLFVDGWFDIVGMPVLWEEDELASAATESERLVVCRQTEIWRWRGGRVLLRVVAAVVERNCCSLVGDEERVDSLIWRDGGVDDAGDGVIISHWFWRVGSARRFGSIFDACKHWRGAECKEPT